jgi:addiction module RelE/StbE family toxin
MNLQYSKDFIKSFQQLKRNEKIRVRDAIALFVHEPYAKQLRNHQLKGKLSSYRSISAGGDIRLHFKEDAGHLTATFIQIGTHSQLY